MKKSLILPCLLAVFWSIKLHSQTFTCPHDTVIDGGFPTLGDFQWSGGGDATLGECPTCIPMDRFWSWTLLDTGNLLVIHGNFFPPCDTIQIRVVSQCRYVYLDTCLPPPVTGSGCEYIMDIDPPTDAQILIYWNSSGTDSIGVIANAVNDGSPLTMVLYDMHLCTVLATDPQCPSETQYYYALSDLTQLRGMPIPVLGEDRIPGIAYVRARKPLE